MTTLLPAWKTRLLVALVNAAVMPVLRVMLLVPPGAWTMNGPVEPVVRAVRSAALMSSVLARDGAKTTEKGVRVRLHGYRSGTADRSAESEGVGHEAESACPATMAPVVWSTVPPMREIAPPSVLMPAKVRVRWSRR